MKPHVICTRQELTPGQLRSFSIGRQRIGVVRTEDDTFYAIGDTCPHQGATLSLGKVERMWISDQVGEAHASRDRSVVVCPWHNFEFDLESGRNPCDPERLRIQTYRVELQGDDVVVYA